MALYHLVYEIRPLLEESYAQGLYQNEHYSQPRDSLVRQQLLVA